MKSQMKTNILNENKGKHIFFNENRRKTNLFNEKQNENHRKTNGTSCCTKSVPMVQSEYLK